MPAPFRNSDFKVNTYFKRFLPELEEARKHGHDVWVNEVRKYNNCFYARKLQGDVSIREIVRAVWPSFKEKYASRLTRPGLVEAVEAFTGCHDFSNGYLYFERPRCGDFYMVGFSCHSRICPSCGKKYRDARSAKVSAKVLEVPHRQFVFTVPQQLRRFFREHRKPMLDALFAAANDAFCLLPRSRAPKAYRREGRKALVEYPTAQAKAAFRAMGCEIPSEVRLADFAAMVLEGKREEEAEKPKRGRKKKAPRLS